MSPVRIRLCAVIAVCALAPTALAAEPDAAELAARPPLTADEPEFRSFIEVWREVAGIRARYAERMHLLSAEDRQALMAEANQEMRAAVERSGMSPQRYNQLAAAAALDPALKARIAAHPEQVSTSPLVQ